MNCNRVVDDIAFNSAARRMEGSPGGGAYTWMPDRLTTSSNSVAFFRTRCRKTVTPILSLSGHWRVKEVAKEVADNK